MDSDEVFDVGLPGYSVRCLSHEDAEALQELFLECEDYFMIVEGRGPSPTEAEEELRPDPPELPPGDRDLFGIARQDGELIGFLEGLRGYPEASVWWIGLLLLVPEIRAHGIGREIVRGYALYAGERGAEAIMLGVVEENKHAFEFWRKMGFDVVHIREPRPFGRKVHRVIVMRKTLVDG